MNPALRRGLRLAGYVLLTLVVYWANVLTPSAARLGILYIVPVLLVTWTEGLTWGIVFAVATTVLREFVAWDQMPPDTPLLWRVANGASYVVVLGIAMAGLQNLRRSQAQLARLVIQDQLTNVLNARAFADRLSQELDRNRRYPRPLALLYMDLDNFKVINDTHGHQTGDAVLRLVADAMRSSGRQADGVGRLGGDDFGVLLPETDGRGAHSVANPLAGGIPNRFRGAPPLTPRHRVVPGTGPPGG